MLTQQKTDDRVEQLRAEVESLRGDVRTLAGAVETIVAQQARLAEALGLIAESSRDAVAALAEVTGVIPRRSEPPPMVH